MSVIESLQRQTKELEENAVSGEGISNTDEKNDDVSEENSDEKSDSDVNNMNLEGDEVGREVKQCSKRKIDDDEKLLSPTAASFETRSKKGKQEDHDSACF